MAGGGGAWKVAYADFVTAMMAFFMVMWLVGQKDNVKSAIAEHFREPPDPFEIWDDTGHPTGPDVEQREGRGGVKNPPVTNEDDHAEARKPRVVKVRSDETDAAVAVLTFKNESAELSDESKQALDRFIPGILGKPQKIEIRGHATRKPLPKGSPFLDAWQLSYARSKTVMEYMEEHGVSPLRMRLSQAAGFEPLSDSVEDAALAKNPRVEVYLLSEYIRGE